MDFLTIYIKEAHAEDEWKMQVNNDQGICYAQPKSLAQRLAIANDFVKRFHYTVPMAVDFMDNRANVVYAGWPERLYILDEQGALVYKGKPGPFGYHPEEVEAWLTRRFGEEKAVRPARSLLYAFGCVFL